MHRRMFIGIVAVTLLAGCIREARRPAAPAEEGGAHKPADVAMTETTEPVATEEAVIIGSGALMERLAPTGILEIGDREAPLTLLSFTEHHCRYCREFHDDLLPQLVKEYVATGKIRYQVVILPLRKYPRSTDAAAALLCAGQQGKGMAMHAQLFESANTQEVISAQSLPDADAFTACLASDQTKELLAQQEGWARSLSVTLVPTFFLNGEKFVGLPYWPDLRGRIESTLGE